MMGGGRVFVCYLPFRPRNIAAFSEGRDQKHIIQRRHHATGM